MKIIVTGGGSGGHITPILAVAHELKKAAPGVQIVYVGQRGDPLADVPDRDPNIDEIYFIAAGKLRRYHGEGLRQLLDLPTVFKNIRDVFRTLGGCWQSYWLLRKLRPDAIFVKGGFVGVPIGLAASLRRVPFVTHDSDALPGLANRIIARWAARHTVALPKEMYKYPADKTITVGVPIARHYRLVTATRQARYRKALGLAAQGRVLLVMGGGNGAKRLNDAVVNCAAHLLARYSDLTILHVTGRTLEDGVRQAYKAELPSGMGARVQVFGFVHELYRYTGAADVVVTRAGGTSMAELAAQGIACVVVPNPQLTGGHQLKNASALAVRHAAIVVEEAKIAVDRLALMPGLTELFDHSDKRKQLGSNLHALAQTDAAARLAMILLEVATSRTAAT